MQMYVMVTRLVSPGTGSDVDPYELSEPPQPVEISAEQRFPGVKWHNTFALLGPYDYMDVFEAPDYVTATSVAELVKYLRRGETSVWLATPGDSLSADPMADRASHAQAFATNRCT